MMQCFNEKVVSCDIMFNSNSIVAMHYSKDFQSQDNLSR